MAVKIRRHRDDRHVGRVWRWRWWRRQQHAGSARRAGSGATRAEPDRDTFPDSAGTTACSSAGAGAGARSGTGAHTCASAGTCARTSSRAGARAYTFADRDAAPHADADAVTRRAGANSCAITRALTRAAADRASGRAHAIPRSVTHTASPASHPPDRYRL